MNGIIGKGKKIFREKLRSFKEVLETAKELSKEESREMIALVLHETLRFLKNKQFRKLILKGGKHGK